MICTTQLASSAPETGYKTHITIISVDGCQLCIVCCKWLANFSSFYCEKCTAL